MTVALVVPPHHEKRGWDVRLIGHVGLIGGIR